MSVENIQPNHSDEMSEALGCETEVLDCSQLPSGTHKHLKAQRVMKLMDGIDWTPILISSGNYAKAIALEAEKVKRRVIIVLDKLGSAYEPIDSEFVEEVEIRDLIAANAELIKRENRNGDPQNLLGHHLDEAYQHYSDPDKPLVKYKFSTGVTEVNRGTPVNVTNLLDIDHLDIFKYQGIHPEDHLLDTYGRLATTITDYDAVFCPVGSGELFYDLYVYSPCCSVDFYGVHPERHPAQIKDDFVEQEPSLADKLTTPVFPISYDFTPYTTTRFSLPGFLMDRTKKMGKCYSFASINEKEIARANELALAAGFDAEYSGSVGFASALDSFRGRHDLRFAASDRVLIVSTGNGGSK